jgi:uncharacterized protein YkwD
MARCFLFLSASALGLAVEAPAFENKALQEIEERVYAAVNQLRNSENKPELRKDERLVLEARRHAENMSLRRFFAHEDPSRGDLARRLDDSKIGWQRCAENIYQGKRIEDPAGDAVRSWLNSAGHKKNMLDSNLTETGVGVAVRKDGTLFIVQEFMLDAPDSRPRKGRNK